MSYYDMIPTLMLYGFSGLSVILFSLVVVNLWSKNSWFCKVMGWHKEPWNILFDGCSLSGKCPRCKKRVLKDSQGNWFRSGNDE